MKKFLWSLCCIWGLFAWWTAVVHAFSVDEITDAPYDDWASLDKDEEALTIGKQVQKEIDTNEGVVQKIMKAFKIDYNTQWQEQTATYFVKNMLNYFLAIAGLVALIVLVLGFYKMFTASDNKEGYKEALQYVTRAAIAIVIIGVSWFLVSWFFDIFIRVRDAT